MVQNRLSAAPLPRYRFETEPAVPAQVDWAECGKKSAEFIEVAGLAATDECGFDPVSATWNCI
jgi:transposase